MAGARFRTTLKKSGAWFDHDPADTFRGNVHTMMAALATRGREDVIGQLEAGNASRRPIRTLGDHVSEHVAGELRRRPSGPAFSAYVFVSTRGMSKADAISTQAAASFLERTNHPFRKTAGRIGRSREAQASELIKGLQ